MPIADLPPSPPALEASAFDLAQLARGEEGDLRTVKPRCPASRSGEIVVCAPDPEKNRVRPLPDTYVVVEGLPRAELRLGENASLDLHLEAKAMPGGAVSNRVMVGTTFKF